jgi:hypothetical protein
MINDSGSKAVIFDPEFAPIIERNPLTSHYDIEPRKNLVKD